MGVLINFSCIKLYDCVCLFLLVAIKLKVESRIVVVICMSMWLCCLNIYPFSFLYRQSLKQSIECSLDFSVSIFCVFLIIIFIFVFIIIPTYLIDQLINTHLSLESKKAFIWTKFLKPSALLTYHHCCGC